MRTLLSQRWFKIILTFTVVGAAFLIGTPYLVKYLARQWLLENGGDRVQVQDVDFNPFKGTLVFTGLDVQVDRETTLSFASAGLDIAWKPLLHRQISVQSVTLNGFNMIIDNRAADILSLGGIALPKQAGEADEMAGEGAPWTSGVTQLTLNDFHLRVLDPAIEADIRLEHLQLSDFAQWAPGQPASVDLAGAFNGAPVKIRGKLAPLADPARYEASVSVSKLQLDAFQSFAQPHLEKLSGLLTYDGELLIEQSANGLRIDEKGKIALDSVDLSVAQPPLAISGATFSSGGDFHYASGEADEMLRLKRDISVGSLLVSGSGQTIQIINSNTLAISQLELEGLDNITIDSIKATGLNLGKEVQAGADNEDGQAFVYVDTLAVSGLALTEQLLTIDTISEDGAQAHMVRDAEGKWNAITIVGMMQELMQPRESSLATETNSGEAAAEIGPTEAADQAGAAEEHPFNMAVNRLEVTGDSKIYFTDHSVKPAFATTLQIGKGSLEKLDTRQPEQKSPINIEGKLGKHSQLSLQGNVQPFLPTPGLGIVANVDAMELPPLSSYTRDSLGLVLDSGTLDVDLKLKTDNSKMDGNVALTLHQLQLETIESENSLQSKIPVPLNVALDTLRDKHNTIKLKIPITGNVNDPSFDPTDAIAQALAGGVSKGALSYLTLALQPYGALITAAKYAGEAVNRVHLNPVTFAPGQSELDATGTDYMAKIAQLMTDRPQLDIRVCGVASAKDLEIFAAQAAAKEKSTKKDKQAAPATPEAVFEPQLRELALQRAAIVRDYLVETHGVSASRLVSCQPRVEADQPEAKPRTDLLI